MVDTVETSLPTRKSLEPKNNNLCEFKTERNLLMFGPVGSGKTTTFSTLCDSLTVEDEFFIHGERVNLTCGKLNISTVEKLFLYTTSKHDYAQPVWEFLQNEMIGIILLIDNRRKDPLRDLEMFLTKLSNNKNVEVVLTKLVIYPFYLKLHVSECLSQSSSRRSYAVMVVSLTNSCNTEMAKFSLGSNASSMGLKTLLAALLIASNGTTITHNQSLAKSVFNSH